MQVPYSLRPDCNILLSTMSPVGVRETIPVCIDVYRSVNECHTEFQLP